MSNQAFMPSGGPFATVLIALSTTPSPAQLISPQSGGLKLFNNSTTPGYFSIGSSQGSSNMLAQLPTTAAPGSIPVLAGSDQTFNTGFNQWLSAMTSAGTGFLNVTPGYGQ